MSYQIEVVTLKPQPVLVMEEEVAPEELGAALARMLPTVHGYASQQGAVITGMPFMRYLSMSDKFLIQAGMPVAEPVTGTDDIMGPYHQVGEAWDAINAWREERGMDSTFGGWDIYENDPSEVSDPKELRTRLKADELPGGKAATTVFLGPYHQVGEAWDAINAWREERGMDSTFGGWDIYENDPSEVSDPKELRTRLYQPLD